MLLTATDHLEKWNKGETPFSYCGFSYILKHPSFFQTVLKEFFQRIDWSLLFYLLHFLNPLEQKHIIKDRHRNKNIFKSNGSERVGRVNSKWMKGLLEISTIDYFRSKNVNSDRLDP